MGASEHPHKKKPQPRADALPSADVSVASPPPEPEPAAAGSTLRNLGGMLVMAIPFMSSDRPTHELRPCH